MSVATDIRDDLVTHDVRVRRVMGDLQRRVDARLSQLATDTKAAMLAADPVGVQRRTARAARVEKLTADVKALAAKAYAEIDSMTNDVLVELAQTESQAVVQAIAKALP